MFRHRGNLQPGLSRRQSRRNGPASPKKSPFNPRLVVFISLFLTSIILLLIARSAETPTYRTTPTTFIHSDRLNPSKVTAAVAAADADETLAPPKLLSYNHRNFTLDGKPIRLISGSLHYFRIPPSRWRTCLVLARRLGLNAIETYVPWNWHEPVEGVFRFSGFLDLPRFLSLAQEVGLLVLLRPGPYICSEWDLGGLPAYLLADRDVHLRSSNEGYMTAVTRYVTTLSTVIAPFVGRPVVALQLENEYGQSVHVDDAYMQALVDMWNAAGFGRDRVMHFTSDNGNADVVAKGSPFDSASVLKTINFGSHVGEHMKTLHNLQPDAPGMVMEFWIGWYDQWGVKHNTRHGERVADMLRQILFEHDASVNFYMFVGGTNFGFMAGANLFEHDVYRADTTSYDYDALLTEFTDVRKSKFNPVRSVLREFWDTVGDEGMQRGMDDELPPSGLLSAYDGAVPLTASIPLLDVVERIADHRVRAELPLGMEEAGGDYGYMLYRHRFATAPKEGSMLQLQGVHDFATVLFDGAVARTVERNRQMDLLLNGSSVARLIAVPADAKVLDILVENSGRVNYGAGLHDRKGLVGNVLLDGGVLKQFDMMSLSFPQDHALLPDPRHRDTVNQIVRAMRGRHSHAPMGAVSSAPAFFHGVLMVTAAPQAGGALGDGLPGSHCRVFGRGVLWVNGFNVGRFHTGVNVPQRSLYVPGELLREGRNDIVVFHTSLHLTQEPPHVEFFEQPDFGAV